jgi:hypothetical protein
MRYPIEAAQVHAHPTYPFHPGIHSTHLGFMTR